MADSGAGTIPSKNPEKTKIANSINRTTSETLRLNETDRALTHPNSLTSSTPRKKTSFIITSVTSRASNDAGDDSADDLDESHTEDISEIVDNSRVTDIETETPSYSEDTFSKDDVFFNASSSLVCAPVIPTSSQYGLAIVPNSESHDHQSNHSDGENSDNPNAHSTIGSESVINLGVVSTKHDPEMRDMPAPRAERFKVVKIESTEPFKRGRWMCMDYLDHPNIAQNANNVNAKSDSDISPHQQSEASDSVSVITNSAASVIAADQHQLNNNLAGSVEVSASQITNTPSEMVNNQQQPNLAMNAAATAAQSNYASVSPGQSLQNNLQTSQLANAQQPAQQAQAPQPTQQQPNQQQQSQSLSQVHMQQILTNSNAHQSLQSQQMQQVLASAGLAQSQPQPQAQQAPQQQQQQAPQQQQPPQQAPPQQQPMQSQQPLQQQPIQQTQPQQQQPLMQPQSMPQQMAAMPQYQQQAQPTMAQQQQYQPIQQQPQIIQQLPQQSMQQQMPPVQLQQMPQNMQQMPLQQQQQQQGQQQIIGQPMQQMPQQLPQQVSYSQQMPPTQASGVTQANSQGMMQSMHPQMQNYQTNQMMTNMQGQPMMNMQGQPHLQQQYYPGTIPQGAPPLGGMTIPPMSQSSIPAGSTVTLPPLQTYPTVTQQQMQQSLAGLPQTPPVQTSMPQQYTLPMTMTGLQPQMTQQQMLSAILQQQALSGYTASQAQPTSSYQQVSSVPSSSVDVRSMIASDHSSSHPDQQPIPTPTAALLESLAEAAASPDEQQQGSEDPESASGANAVAIDNKIEQAMDLVKSHLMFTVREEVEVLKEKIAELMERIGQLEVENNILRSNASPETLAQIPPPRAPLASNPP